MRKQLMELVQFIKELYPNDSPVPLHAPRFLGKEKDYLCECIDTTYVSYVGAFVTRFEDQVKQLTGIKHAIAMVNGTAAIQMSLVSAGISPGDEVITQALTFVATANGIVHSGGVPVFVDVDRDTMGMSPSALGSLLDSEYVRKAEGTFSRTTGKKLFAVMPMHTFGFACRVLDILEICKAWNIKLIEDTAESIGTTWGDHHTGFFSSASCLSFNGNKPVTTGGGGMLLTNDDDIAARARHISTTAKQKHPWEYFHDEVGWNLRMPNINAAIGCAQMDRFDATLRNKRETASRYIAWGNQHDIVFSRELPGTRANYWLNAVILKDQEERNEFLEFSNANGVQTRPVWVLIPKLPMYARNPKGPIENAAWLEERVVNLPSSVRP